MPFWLKIGESVDQQRSYGAYGTATDTFRHNHVGWEVEDATHATGSPSTLVQEVFPKRADETPTSVNEASRYNNGTAAPRHTVLLFRPCREDCAESCTVVRKSTIGHLRLNLQLASYRFFVLQNCLHTFEKVVGDRDISTASSLLADLPPLRPIERERHHAPRLCLASGCCELFSRGQHASKPVQAITYVEARNCLEPQNSGLLTRPASLSRGQGPLRVRSPSSTGRALRGSCR